MNLSNTLSFCAIYFEVWCIYLMKILPIFDKEKKRKIKIASFIVAAFGVTFTLRSYIHGFLSRRVIYRWRLIMTIQIGIL